MSSSKLFIDARGLVPGDVKSPETPYVVIFQAVNQLAVDPQECWSFEHPAKMAVLDSAGEAPAGLPVFSTHTRYRLSGLPYTNNHNVRSAHLTFSVPHAGILHGLAGYFEACLYKDVGLSIHPHRQAEVSPNMLSWFPLFFPFKVSLAYTEVIHHSHPILRPRNRSICQLAPKLISPSGA